MRGAADAGRAVARAQGGEAAGGGAGAAAAGQLPAPQKLGKDPTVHTDFLPDQERDAQEVAVRAQLRKEYELRQKVAPETLHKP